MDRKARGPVLLMTLILAGIGQYYFAKLPEHYVDGILFYILAVLLVLLLVRQPRPSRDDVSVAGPGLSIETLMRAALTIAGLLIGLAAVLALARSPDQGYWPIFWLWIAGIVCFLLAQMPIPRWRAGTPEPSSSAASVSGDSWRAYAHPVNARVLMLRDRVRSNGWELGLVVLLLVAAFALRAWRIDTIPWTLSGDEGSQGLWARDVISGRVTNMFGLGWLSVPNMSFFWQAGWFRLLGDGISGLRLPWAVVGVLTVLGTYLLVRRLFDRRLALLTAFLLATYHYHIHYSRLGSNQVADPLFMVWALYFVSVGFQKRRPWAWALSGVVAGLAFYFYAGSRQVPVILGAALGWAALTEPGFIRDHRRDLLVMFGAFAVTVGPMLLQAVQRPDDFNARINQVGIFQSGWLDREAQITGRTKLSLLLEQFRRSFLAFNLYRDRTSWYGAAIPLMEFLASIFFVLGTAISVFRLRQWRYAVFVIWFASVVVLGGALTESPPSSQRLVSTAVPAMFFVAVALRELTRALSEWIGMPEFGRRALAACIACVLALLSIHYYFGPYQRSWTFGNTNAEIATRIGYYLRDLGPDWEEYFFGAPRMYADFASTPFIAKGVSSFDVTKPLAQPPDFVDPMKRPVFIFLPERAGEIEWVRHLYPSGALEEVHRGGDPQAPLLFISYRPAGK
jgi:4-amino-4-deoxy-L-arabinose transferase-like glycosyltransferase